MTVLYEFEEKMYRSKYADPRCDLVERGLIKEEDFHKYKVLGFVKARVSMSDVHGKEVELPFMNFYSPVCEVIPDFMAM